MDEPMVWRNQKLDKHLWPSPTTAGGKAVGLLTDLALGQRQAGGAFAKRFLTEIEPKLEELRRGLDTRVRVLRNGVYRDPGFVFITGEGTPLSLKSITNVMGNAFRAAGVEDASGHRLRAHGITEVFEAIYLADRKRLR